MDVIKNKEQLMTYEYNDTDLIVEFSKIEELIDVEKNHTWNSEKGKFEDWEIWKNKYMIAWKTSKSNGFNPCFTSKGFRAAHRHFTKCCKAINFIDVEYIK